MSLRVLQRACACGGTPGPTGECAQCRAKRLEQESVQKTLSGPARPLDRETRAAFEDAWGHDFSTVRIHADDDAARSAEAVGARAYTVGRDVAFARGRYAPDTDAGRRLLAHELTHVRQQAAAPAPARPTLRRDAAAEAEADRAPVRVTQRLAPALQRQDEPATPGVDVGAAPEPTQAPPAAAAPPICDPARSLRWADFTGTVPAAPTHDAFTGLTWRDNGTTFRSIFTPSSSWVVAKVTGAGARATNGCAPEVTACRAVYDGLAPGSSATVPRGGPVNCPAAAFTDVEANTRGECETVIGAACDADASADSARLLRHEQLHFDIGCTLVRRANTAAAGGTPRADIRTWLTNNYQPQQDQYDTDTDHGCKPTEQATWQTSVAGGLTGVTGP